MPAPPAHTASTSTNAKGFMQTLIHRDSKPWQFQVWASFTIAVFLCAVGLSYLPGRDLDRAFMVMGYFFCLSAAFVLAKYERGQKNVDAINVIAAYARIHWAAASFIPISRLGRCYDHTHQKSHSGLNKTPDAEISGSPGQCCQPTAPCRHHQRCAAQSVQPNDQQPAPRSVQALQRAAF